MSVMDRKKVGPFEDEAQRQMPRVAMGSLGNVVMVAGLTGRDFPYALTDVIAEGTMESGKTTVAEAASDARSRRRRKASPKAVALLERFKAVPSVDPHLFREDLDRVLDSTL
jgi:hypothetical protein